MLLPNCSVMGASEGLLAANGTYHFAGVLKDLEGEPARVELHDGGSQTCYYAGRITALTGKLIREVLQQTLVVVGKKAAYVGVELTLNDRVYLSGGRLDGNPEVITAHLRRVVRKAIGEAQR